MKNLTSQINNVKEWISEIGYLRGLSALAVIAIHVVSYNIYIVHPNVLVFITIFINSVSHFAIPMFVILSGFLLFHKYHDKTISLKEFYLSQLGKIIPPFLIFSVFYSIVNGHSFNINHLPVTIIKIVSGRSSGHLWFLPLIIQLYLIYPLLHRAYLYAKTRNNVYHVVLGLIFFQIVFDIFDLFMRFLYSSLPIQGMLRRIFVSHLSYFFFGLYIRDNYSAFKKWLSSLRLSVICILMVFLNSLLSSFGYLEMGRHNGIANVPPFLPLSVLSTILGSLGLFVNSILFYKIGIALLSQQNNRNNKIAEILNRLGKYSFGIYLIHVFFVVKIVTLLNALKISPYDWVFYPITFSISVVLSYMTIHFLSYLPYARYIVGVRTSIYLQQLYNSSEM